MADFLDKLGLLTHFSVKNYLGSIDKLCRNERLVTEPCKNKTKFTILVCQ